MDRRQFLATTAGIARRYLLVVGGFFNARRGVRLRFYPVGWQKPKSLVSLLQTAALLDETTPEEWEQCSAPVAALRHLRPATSPHARQ